MSIILYFYWHKTQKRPFFAVFGGNPPSGGMYMGVPGVAGQKFFLILGFDTCPHILSAVPHIQVKKIKITPPLALRGPRSR